MVKAVMLDAGSLAVQDLDLSALRELPLEWIIHEATSPQQCRQRIAGAGIVLSNKVTLDADTLSQADALRMVQVMATGTNNVDLAAAAGHGITVCNARAYAATSVAQHTLMLILSLARNLPAYTARVRHGEWQRSPVFCLLADPIRDLDGLRLGLVGYGAIGREVARIAQAFGMNVRLARLAGRDDPLAEPYPRLPLAKLLTETDVLSLHCPLTPETRGLIGSAEFARMPRGSFLVNTARGGIVDDDALLRALEDGQLAGAAVDTISNEPPAAGHPLLEPGHPRLLVTPHVAWASLESRQSLVNRMAANIRAFLDGQVPTDRVTAPAAPDRAGGR